MDYWTLSLPSITVSSLGFIVRFLVCLSRRQLTRIPRERNPVFYDGTLFGKPWYPLNEE